MSAFKWFLLSAFLVAANGQISYERIPRNAHAPASRVESKEEVKTNLVKDLDKAVEVVLTNAGHGENRNEDGEQEHDETVKDIRNSMKSIKMCGTNSARNEDSSVGKVHSINNTESMELAISTLTDIRGEVQSGQPLDVEKTTLRLDTVISILRNSQGTFVRGSENAIKRARSLVDTAQDLAKASEQNAVGSPADSQPAKRGFFSFLFRFIMRAIRAIVRFVRHFTCDCD